MDDRQEREQRLDALYVAVRDSATVDPAPVIHACSVSVRPTKAPRLTRMLRLVLRGPYRLVKLLTGFSSPARSFK